MAKHWPKLLAALLALYIVSELLVMLRASTDRRKDIVFVGPLPHCIGDAVECADSLHFNGDWRGVKLCRAGRCVKYEDVFTFVRESGPVEPEGRVQ